MKFRSVVELGAKTATGIEVPEKVVTQLGAGKRPPVRVTIKGHSYPSTIAARGDRFLLPLSAENREKAGVGAGDKIEVEVELDTAERTVEVPAELAKALAKSPAAKKRFEQWSNSRKQRLTLAVGQAKTEETRQRRIEKGIAELLEEA